MAGEFRQLLPPVAGLFSDVLVFSCNSFNVLHLCKYLMQVCGGGTNVRAGICLCDHLMYGSTLLSKFLKNTLNVRNCKIKVFMVNQNYEITTLVEIDILQNIPTSTQNSDFFSQNY